MWTGYDFKTGKAGKVKMSILQTIKQLEEKNVANEINYMVWSDRMDLVASSNLKGKLLYLSVF